MADDEKKTKDERVAYVSKQYKYLKAARKSSGWDEDAETGMRMVFGDQWPVDIKSELTEQRRAPLVFNVILPAIDLLIGNMLSNRAELRAVPDGDGADPYIARFITKSIKHIEYNSRVKHERKAQFIDGLITGVGVKEKWYDTEFDLKGKVKVSQFPSTQAYLDPSFRKQDYSDARVFARELWLTKDEIRRIYGNEIAKNLQMPKKDDIQDYVPEEFVTHVYGEDSDYGNLGANISTEKFHNVAEEMGYDVKNRLYRVVELYEKKWEEVDMVYDEDTDDYIEAGSLSEEERAMVDSYIVQRKRQYIHLTSIVGTQLAENADMEAEDFNQLFDFFFPYFYNGYFMGVVKNLTDPQMEINKRHSTIIHILTSLANSGIFYQKGIFNAEDAANLQNLLAKNGMAIEVEQLYDENGRQNIQERRPPEVPAILPHLIDRSEEWTKYISGAGDAIQGNVPRKQSGVAKRTEVAQAQTRLMNMVDNFRYMIESEGKSYIWYIQTYYTDERLIRIYGDQLQDTPEEIEINKRALGQIANDVTIGEYDIRLVFEGLAKSERERTKYELIELANMVPQYADIIAEQVLELCDLPEADKIRRKWLERQAQIQQQQQMAMMQGMPERQGGSARGGIQSSPRPSTGMRRQPQQTQSA